MGHFNFILILTILLAMYGCKADEDNCSGKPNDEDYIENRNQNLISHNIADTLIFKKYRIKKIDNKRIYELIGEEQFIATDSTTKKLIEHSTSSSAECPRYINRNTYILNFKGNTKLEFRLKPFALNDYIIIYFAGKEFQRFDVDFNNQIYILEQLTIENKKFYKVNYISGYSEGNWGSTGSYVDSTYAFYNLEHGILKFIINDTVAYHRIVN